MYVCRKCHEQDARSINCNKLGFEGHNVMILGNCEICGLWASIILCSMYDVAAQKERELVEKEIKEES